MLGCGQSNGGIKWEYVALPKRRHGVTQNRGGVKCLAKKKRCLGVARIEGALNGALSLSQKKMPEYSTNRGGIKWG